ncbi:MAG: NAD(+) diphosphatase [Tannerellaceae bacterium]|nr:NAD(+) diphosphatase [Tannerellaceae bacterium]MCD7932762.1 NAD(+) diphosphatase [Tannerellaceae bacterium]
MIQDILPHIFNNSYQSIQPTGNDFIFLFKGREVVFIEDENGIRLPRLNELAEPETTSSPIIYYFSIDKIRYFGMTDWENIPDGFRIADVNIFREAQPKYTAFAGATAFGLASWYNNHRFCGRCGQPMQHSSTERMLQCPACSNSEYPKISPAVIVGVTHGDKLLLTKYANRQYTNYALIAGFAEIGETIEQTVHREVMEEAGIKVKNLRFYKSQPWGFTDCLLMGFFAELDGDDTITMDKEELSVAEWIDRKNMEPGNASLSLTGEMIEYFRNGLPL